MQKVTGSIGGSSCAGNGNTGEWWQSGRSPCLNPEYPFLAYQEAMLVALKSLMPTCLFNVIGFGSTFKTLFPASQTYNEVRRRNLKAGGQWVVKNRGKEGKEGGGSPEASLQLPTHQQPRSQAGAENQGEAIFA